MNKYGKITQVMIVMSTINIFADGTNSVPAQLGTTINKTEMWDILIAVISPIVVYLISKFVVSVPKQYKFILPACTPIVGIALSWLLSLVSDLNIGWYDAAKAGALAVFIRETWNQTVTKLITTDDKVSPSEPEVDQSKEEADKPEAEI